MAHEAGKGSKPRPTDLDKFDEGYDRIFGKKEKPMSDKKPSDDFFFTEDEWSRTVGWGTRPTERDPVNRKKPMSEEEKVRKSLETLSDLAKRQQGGRGIN